MDLEYIFSGGAEDEGGGGRGGGSGGGSHHGGERERGRDQVRVPRLPPVSARVSFASVSLPLSGEFLSHSSSSRS